MIEAGDLSGEVQELCKDRVDLIKRLFGVSISVGFASQFSRIVLSPGYSHDYHLDTGRLAGDHWRDGTLLIISLIGVVASWEGYLRAIHNNPLEDRARFYIDIILVILYLVLMLSSQIFYLWFHVVVLIFFCYLLWDIARILNLRKDAARKDTRKGPSASISITGVWFGFFIVLDLLVHFDLVRIADGWLDFVGGAAAALLGFVLYRVDKWKRPGWFSKAFLVFSALLPLILCRVA